MASSGGEIPSNFEEVNGVNFHYQTVGEGDHVLLLLPGTLGSSKSSLSRFEKLNREKFHIVGFDPRGYGKSRPPDRDFPMDFYNRDAKDAGDFMAAIGHTKYSVLGYSDGAISAVILAAEFHDSIRKVVLWGCNTYYTERDAELIQANRDINKWGERAKTSKVEQYGEDYFRKTWKGWGDCITNIVNGRKAGDVCMSECKRIHRPTLILHGDKDPMVPLEHPIYLQQNIRDSRLVRFPDGKHNIHRQYADEFNRHVEDFLLKEE